MKQKFIESVLGGYDPGAFAGFVFWALVGTFLIVNIHAQRRDPGSNRTPFCFSWKYWLRDNPRRILFNLACILTTIRFSQDITGRSITDFWALVIGLSFDLLAIGLDKLRIIKLIGTGAVLPKKEEQP